MSRLLRFFYAGLILVIVFQLSVSKQQKRAATTRLFLSQLYIILKCMPSGSYYTHCQSASEINLGQLAGHRHLQYHLLPRSVRHLQLFLMDIQLF